MQAIDAGVDFADENALNRFMATYSTNLMDRASAGDGYPAQYQRPAPENPFKHLSRNQVITV